MGNYKLQSNITSELSIKMSVKQQKTSFSNHEWILGDVSVPVCEVGGGSHHVHVRQDDTYDVRVGSPKACFNPRF